MTLGNHAAFGRRHLARVLCRSGHSLRKATAASKQLEESLYTLEYTEFDREYYALCECDSYSRFPSCRKQAYRGRDAQYQRAFRINFSSANVWQRKNRIKDHVHNIRRKKINNMNSTALIRDSFKINIPKKLALKHRTCFCLKYNYSQITSHVAIRMHPRVSLSLDDSRLTKTSRSDLAMPMSQTSGAVLSSWSFSHKLEINKIVNFVLSTYANNIYYRV